MTSLVLVRHAETIWHDENRYAGSSEVPLSRRGREQAGWLAEWAGDAKLDAIWVSPLDRARMTAAPAGRASGLEPRVDARLRELDFGRGEGLSLAEMEKRFPEELQAFRANPVANHLPGGEDPKKAAERVISCLHDIAAAHPGGRVLVVMHTTVKRLALCGLMGLPLDRYRQLFPSVANCALTEIRLDGDGIAVLQFNTPTDPRWNGRAPGGRPS